HPLQAQQWLCPHEIYSAYRSRHYPHTQIYPYNQSIDEVSDISPPPHITFFHSNHSQQSRKHHPPTTLSHGYADLQRYALLQSYQSSTYSLNHLTIFKINLLIASAKGTRKH